MGLVFTPPTEQIEFPGGHLVVRGLSLPDITTIVQHHGTALAGLLSAITAARSGQFDLDNMLSMALSLVDVAPAAAIEAIAIAADVPDEIDLVAKLNASVQIDALAKIGALTFTSEGAVGKVLEAVVSALSGTTKLVQTLRQP